MKTIEGKQLSHWWSQPLQHLQVLHPAAHHHSKKKKAQRALDYFLTLIKTELANFDKGFLNLFRFISTFAE